MKKSKDFYIGWKDEMPKDIYKRVRLFTILVIALIPLLAFILVYGQKEFRKGTFAFGQLETFTGILHYKPIPILEINEGGKKSYVLLVGLGKFGAESIISKAEEKFGPLNERFVKIEGTPIVSEEKSLIELSKNENSILEVFDSLNQDSIYESEFEDVILEGEIIDPKCYFGVMKPGEGKIHKSCAIRCISGGIPPVLRSYDENENPIYYIILGLQGQKINKSILKWVAEDISIPGKTKTINGWHVLYTDPMSINSLQ